MKIHIQHGHVVDPKNNINAKQDVFIAAGRIVAINDTGEVPDGFVANQTIDASGQYVIPGLVDLSARLVHQTPTQCWMNLDLWKC